MDSKLRTLCRFLRREMRAEVEKERFLPTTDMDGGPFYVGHGWLPGAKKRTALVLSKLGFTANQAVEALFEQANRDYHAHYNRPGAGDPPTRYCAEWLMLTTGDLTTQRKTVFI
jgi:hypothetical protein